MYLRIRFLLLSDFSYCVRSGLDSGYDQSSLNYTIPASLHRRCACTPENVFFRGPPPRSTPTPQCITRVYHSSARCPVLPYTRLGFILELYRKLRPKSFEWLVLGILYFPLTWAYSSYYTEPEYNWGMSKLVEAQLREYANWFRDDLYKKHIRRLHLVYYLQPTIAQGDFIHHPHVPNIRIIPPLDIRSGVCTLLD